MFFADTSELFVRSKLCKPFITENWIRLHVVLACNCEIMFVSEEIIIKSLQRVVEARLVGGGAHTASVCVV